MALLSYALTTLARTKTFLGISNNTNDGLLTSLINAVTVFIERYCDRRFLQTAYSNEVYNGNGTNKLVLKNYPVSSSATFTLQRRDSVDNQSSFSTIDSEEYFVENTPGIVHYVNRIFERLVQHYRITYTAGYNFDNAATYLEDAGAGDLEYACWKLVGKLFNQRNSDSNVESESLGDYSVSFRKEAMADKEIKEILNKYKRPYGF